MAVDDKEKDSFHFSVERTNEDGTYTVVFRCWSFDEGLEFLKTVQSPLRHELNCPAWVNTDFGYAPMAWVN